MASYARSIFRDSEPGALEELVHAGSSLENIYVFDATARELKSMGTHLVEVVDEQVDAGRPEPLINRFVFRRLR